MFGLEIVVVTDCNLIILSQSFKGTDFLKKIWLSKLKFFHSDLISLVLCNQFRLMVLVRRNILSYPILISDFSLNYLNRKWFTSSSSAILSSSSLYFSRSTSYTTCPTFFVSLSDSIFLLISSIYLRIFSSFFLSSSDILANIIFMPSVIALLLF